MDRPLSIAFLGAPGSFSEDAARVHAGRAAQSAVLHGLPEPEALTAGLAQGACDRAVLPVANTSGGLVRAALQSLSGRRFEVLDEVELAVSLWLFVRGAGVALADVARVVSHPQALRQSARTLARLLPGRASEPASDTASAARALALGTLDASTAVLASARAGERYGLVALARDVQDEAENRTFFAVLGRPRDPGRAP
jgi:prephenate dehydratase